jgi:hypothetical protein
MTLLQDSTAELCEICYKDGYAQGKQDIIDIIIDMHKRGMIQDYTLYRFIDNLSALKGVE